MLCKAGFMLNLRKCKFLVVAGKLLGFEISGEGYQLAGKFMSSWSDMQIPTSLKQLQVILGKLLWASPLIPHFKQRMVPLEKLLKGKGTVEWTEECTQAMNDPLAALHVSTKLQLPNFGGVFRLYPSVSGEFAFVAVTQPQGDAIQEAPVAFVSRRLTPTELKRTPVEQFVGVAVWATRKLKRFTTTAKQVVVVCPEEEWPTLLASEEVHLKVRAMVIEMALYNCKWMTGENPWALGGALVEVPTSDTGAVQVEGSPVTWTHKPTTLKMPIAAAGEPPSLQCPGPVTAYFDGGSGQRLGTGGFCVWDGQLRLVVA